MDSRERVAQYLDMLKAGESTPFFEHEGDRYMRARMVIDTGSNKVTFTDEEGNALYDADLSRRIQIGDMITFEDIVFALRVTVGSIDGGDGGGWMLDDETHRLIREDGWEEEDNPF